MPIIPRVGRKNFKIRLVIAALYTVLTLGAVTMIYPFLLMLATSITSSTDTNEFRVVPRYLTQDTPLFAKYVDDKYEGDVESLRSLYLSDVKKIEQATLPLAPSASGAQAFVADWQSFLKTLPPAYKRAGFRGYGKNKGLLVLEYKDYVRARFKGDIEALNRSYTEENTTFDTVNPPIERVTSRNWNPNDTPKMQDFQAWKAQLSEERLIVVGVEPLFAKYLKEDSPRYKGSLAQAGKVWGLAHSFDEVVLPDAPPSAPEQRHDWEEFVRTKLPYRYLAPLPEALPDYRAFLRERHKTIAKLNQSYGTNYADFAEIAYPTVLPEGGSLVIDWGDFIAKAIPLDRLRILTPENLWREYVAEKYGQSLDRVNNTYGLSLGSLSALKPPYWLSDAAYVLSNAASLRRSYATRNYAQVVDYILLHGRALVVTLVFCLAVIATTLIVNPLCAYALSRYSLPYAYKVLLFLLATMAFPAEVALIPNFLLLKQLGLLNTYWALILPGAASGFSIFLLKGFFDSLPKEIYEAGTIDGASETRMFFNLTLPLSKPIFAVIALQAFTGAYGAFMFALLVCQDPKMWTLMVWLYELQINNPQYIMMAALTVAALPTLLVFLFAQNIIMRGIILPSYK